MQPISIKAIAPKHRFQKINLEENTATAVVSSNTLTVLSQGHFPNDPLVPGSYLLALVADLALEMLRQKAHYQLVSVESCVFIDPVRPDRPVTLRMRHHRHKQEQQEQHDKFLVGEVLIEKLCVMRSLLLFKRMP